MKNFFIALALLATAISFAQEPHKYTREGTTFTQTQTVKSSSDTETAYTYVIKETSYNIWITKNGRCYIIKTSKNGNQYKQYLDKEICLAICQELGIEYKE